MLGQKKFFSFRSLLFLIFSFFSIVSLTYAATTIGNNIFTSGTITSQGKAYLTGGVSTPILNATSSLIDSLTSRKINMASLNFNNQNDQGIIYKGNLPFVYTFGYGWNGTTFPYGLNFFAGYKAGNTSMGSTATGVIQSSFNTGVGDLALQANATGYNNTALGMQALTSNYSGYGNTGVGEQALFGCSVGYFNTAIGSEALHTVNTGYDNTAIGANSLHQTTGNRNSALGYGSLWGDTTGYNNLALGFDALFANTTGYNNIGIGYNAEAAAATDNNEIIIGNNATGAGSNSVVLGNDSIAKTLLKGKIGIGTTTPTAILTVTGSSYLDGTVTAPLLYATSSLIDNLTLGTGKLNLPDTMAITGNQGIIYKGGVPFLYNFNYGTNTNGILPDGHNLFLGKNAGNLTMGSTAATANESSYNIGIGEGALHNNTTGGRNTAIGYQTLYNNTVGWSNAVNGYHALYAGYDVNENVANGAYAMSGGQGDANVANGAYALYSCQGNFNVANGAYAMYNNIDGWGNIAIGYKALYNLDGWFTAASYNIGIGGNAELLGTADTNEIVIGTNAVGAGSNSVVLGNDSITKTLLKGKVGIASTTPEEALTVGGNIYASGTVMSTNLSVAKTVTSTNISLAKVKFTPTATPTDPAVGDCFMDNGAKPQVSCYDGVSWHTLW